MRKKINIARFARFDKKVEFFGVFQTTVLLRVLAALF